ncbi:MAG: VapC toxin family PIN domain ribonuclease [Acidobacteria bacterium]|nr:VapC toxin family PIN domain ribonuclease [Acidobacteriota bacterium]MDP7340687.1 PIN domain-containing protein [Vicinamibacterales bacterium]MDP7477892.1 PIN domain-containing protein [Vicinamibacterales bacterium]MDP7693507.1 PIN domain-containing protein [Vicinamibacterales bacterium]HJN44620.1 PIN domain-containing protein [Vicinamibacterales bacterium]
MIVADTGAIVALLDAGDRHHASLREIYMSDPDSWVLPWAVLPEVDYLVATQLGGKAEEMFLADLAGGAFGVEWGQESDLNAAKRICQQYADLQLGLVDGVVIATAERIGASAVATLDLRHFGAVTIAGQPKLLPRDA